MALHIIGITTKADFSCVVTDHFRITLNIRVRKLIMQEPLLFTRHSATFFIYSPLSTTTNHLFILSIFIRCLLFVPGMASLRK